MGMEKGMRYSDPYALRDGMCRITWCGTGTLIGSSPNAKTRAIGATDKSVAQHLGVAELRPPSLDLRELLSVPIGGSSSARPYS